MVIPSAEDSQRDAVITRLFDGVLRSARSQLLRAESPLAAEVWGSGLMAVWDSLPATPGDTVFSGDTPGSPGATSFAEALVRHAADLGTPDGMAVLAALAAVAPSRVATRARTAAAMLEQQGVAAPAWAAVAGKALPTEAWIGSDVYGDQEIVIVGFAYPEPARRPRPLDLRPRRPHRGRRGQGRLPGRPAGPDPGPLAGGRGRRDRPAAGLAGRGRRPPGRRPPGHRFRRPPGSHRRADAGRDAGAAVRPGWPPCRRRPTPAWRSSTPRGATGWWPSSSAPPKRPTSCRSRPP